MSVNINLKDLFNGLIYNWKAYEETEYMSHQISGDKIIIANSEEHVLLIGYIITRLNQLLKISTTYPTDSFKSFLLITM